jgi:hypothetical protein
MGVGFSVNPTGTELTLAEAWSGTAWTAKSTPNPAGARNSLLASVACPSPTACVGAGDYVSATDVKTPLVETWNGTTWTLGSAPSPAGATGAILRGVACSAASACTAVGSYVSGGSTLALAERWNGTSWNVESTPSVSGATSTQLVSVSCPTATACDAVGQYTNSSGATVLLSEGWNGTAWAVQSAPSPSGATGATFTGVSCTGATACTAGGNSTNSSSQTRPLAELWNGHTWALQATPIPSGASAVGLDGVSCLAGGSCTATGFSKLAVTTPLAMDT